MAGFHLPIAGWFCVPTDTTTVSSFKHAEKDLKFVIDKIPPSLLPLFQKAKSAGFTAMGYVAGTIIYQVLEYAVITAVTAGIGAAIAAPKAELMMIKLANFLEKMGVAKSAANLVTIAEVIAPNGWISKLKFVEYLGEVKTIANNRKIVDSQEKLLIKAIENNTFEYLGKEGAESQRSLFNSKKAQLIKEWETNQSLAAGKEVKWPRYRKDIPAASGGDAFREAGELYDAHEIIPNSYGGPLEWWNIHPAKAPKQHQGGVHGLGRLFRKLFPLD